MTNPSPEPPAFVHDPTRTFEFNVLEENEVLRRQLKAKEAQISSMQDDGQTREEDEFGSFTCPSCGGHWFGTSFALDDEKRRVHCHDQLGKGCNWSGRGEEAGLKYPKYRQSHTRVEPEA